MSAGWLLGLTDRTERPADVVAASVTTGEAPRGLVDERVLAWRRGCGGVRVREISRHLDLLVREVL